VSYKRQRKGGSSFLVDDANNIVAISFSNYVLKQKFTKQVAEQKRTNILNYLKTHKDEKYFIRLGNGEIYLTPDGENFVTVCNYALSTPKISITKKLAERKPQVTNVVSKQSVEKLDDGGAKPTDDYILRAENWISDLASISSHTDNPFSNNKSYQNPYGEKNGKRVFIDLYRNLNGVHEGYIVLGKKGTVNAMQSKLIECGSFAAMRKEYGDNIKLYVIASSFDDKAIEYVKLNLFNVECKPLLKMAEELVLEARKYYEEADACFKMKDWGKRYESLFSCSSSNTETGTPHFVASSFFNSSSASFSRASLSNMSNVVAFSAKSV
jgi:hypothetical protein